MARCAPAWAHSLAAPVATGEGSASVTLEAGSSWTLTGDSSVDSLDGDLSGLDLNGFTLTVGGAVYEG